MQKGLKLICFFLLLWNTVCRAESTQQVPTGDDAVTGTWNIYPASPTTYYDKVEDAIGTPDDDATYIYCTAKGRITFTFSAFSIPSNATITNVNIYFRHKKIANGGANIGTVIKVGGNYYLSTGAVNPTRDTWVTSNSIGLVATEWTTNPKTAVAWTVDDVNGIGANALEAFGVNRTGTNQTPYCTQVYAEVNYTLPTLSISVTPASWAIPGIIDAGTTQLSDGTTKIGITNDGTVAETFTLQISNQDDRGMWTASTSTGTNLYIFSGVFCATTDAPISTSFNESTNEDMMSTSSQVSTATKFAYSGGTADGVNVPSSGSRSLWFRFDTPTAESGAYIGQQHTITITIGCQ